MKWVITTFKNTQLYYLYRASPLPNSRVIWTPKQEKARQYDNVESAKYVIDLVGLNDASVVQALNYP